MKQKKQKPSHKIEFDVLGANKRENLINELAHAADLFDKGKQYAAYHAFKMTGKGDLGLSKLCEALAGAYKKIGGYAVFVGIRTIDGERADHPHAYLMDGVHTISMEKEDGSPGWSLFKDLLDTLGYAATTDENNRVLSVAYK